jgi:hypothetical protein
VSDQESARYLRQKSLGYAQASARISPPPLVGSLADIWCRIPHDLRMTRKHTTISRQPQKLRAFPEREPGCAGTSQVIPPCTENTHYFRIGSSPSVSTEPELYGRLARFVIDDSLPR